MKSYSSSASAINTIALEMLIVFNKKRKRKYAGSGVQSSMTSSLTKKEKKREDSD